MPMSCLDCWKQCDNLLKDNFVETTMFDTKTESTKKQPDTQVTAPLLWNMVLLQVLDAFQQE